MSELADELAPVAQSIPVVDGPGKKALADQRAIVSVGAKLPGQAQVVVDAAESEGRVQEQESVGAQWQSVSVGRRDPVGAGLAGEPAFINQFSAMFDGFNHEKFVLAVMPTDA